jgi:urease accessory protein
MTAEGRTALSAEVLSPAQLLTLARWLSPAFPTGGFAWSHGLEQAVRDGTVMDAAGLEDWLDGCLRWGAGRTDAILVGAAWRAGEEELAAVAELALALAPSRERRMEAAQQGAALARTLRALHGWDLPDMALPVALGRAARLGGLPPRPVATVALQGFVTTLVQAAQRLMPLGQTQAQRIVLRLAPVCEVVAGEAVERSPDEIGSCSWAVDVASMRHERLEPRIFRS